MRYIHRLAISIAVCQIAGIVGSLFTAPSITGWYATLEKPPFTPPDWLFAPAWITLYVLMGISASLVWQKGINIARNRAALGIFTAQLLLNVFWSMAFFGLQSPLLGMIVIGLLWVAILVTMAAFFSISKIAGILLLPYIMWVTFAAILNISIFVLNR